MTHAETELDGLRSVMEEGRLGSVLVSRRHLWLRYAQSHEKVAFQSPTSLVN